MIAFARQIGGADRGAGERARRTGRTARALGARAAGEERRSLVPIDERIETLALHAPARRPPPQSRFAATAVRRAGYLAARSRFTHRLDASSCPFLAELDLILWTRVDVTDDDVTQRVVVATTNGIKRVILQSLPDMQV